MLLITLIVITISLYYLYHKITKNLDYWKKRNVPYLKPKLLFGNYIDLILLKKYVGSIAKEICEKFPKEPYIGTFYGTDPALLVQDLNIIKLVLSKDFIYFSGRENNNYTHNEILTKNIFFNGGNEWKALRQDLTPLFTTAKVRNMFALIDNCTKEFERYLNEIIKIDEKVSVRSFLTRYTMSCIMLCAYGLNPDTLKVDEENKNIYVNIGDKLFQKSKIQCFKLIMRAMWPSLFYGLGLKLFEDAVPDFFNEVFLKASQNRDLSASTKNDYVDHFLKLQKKDKIYYESLKNPETGNKSLLTMKVSEDLISFQSLSLFGAGFETTSTTMSFLLYELAKNKEVQDKVIEEVDDYFKRHKGEIEYECVNEMPYLEACIAETLRLYPVLGVITREVMNKYTLPTGLTLEKGLRIHIPVYHLHKNPEYFPEPEVFRPERFLGEEKNKINQFAFLPFGNGPRICIGIRFAKMPMTAGILTIFKKYRLDLDDNMPVNINFQPFGLTTQAKEEIYLKCKPRQF